MAEHETPTREEYYAAQNNAPDPEGSYGEDPAPSANNLGRRDTRKWVEDAACRSSGELTVYFFPPYGEEKAEAKARRENIAKSICRQCIVREQCLSYAVSNREKEGIWGGLTPEEVRTLYR